MVRGCRSFHSASKLLLMPTMLLGERVGEVSGRELGRLTWQEARLRLPRNLQTLPRDPTNN